MRQKNMSQSDQGGSLEPTSEQRDALASRDRAELDLIVAQYGLNPNKKE
jgi:hypothetical protein